MNAAGARKRKSRGIRRFGRAGDFVPLTFSLRDIAVLARFDWLLIHLQPLYFFSLGMAEEKASIDRIMIGTAARLCRVAASEAAE